MCRCEDNIKTDLKENVYEGVEWIGLRLGEQWQAGVKTVENRRVR